MLMVDRDLMLTHMSARFHIGISPRLCFCYVAGENQVLRTSPACWKPEVTFVLGFGQRLIAGSDPAIYYLAE